MRITVEWQTEIITTYRTELDVPAEVLAGETYVAVRDWIYDSNHPALLAAEVDPANVVSEEFTRQTTDWQGIPGTYGDEHRITVRLP